MIGSNISCLTTDEKLFAQALEENNPGLIEDINPHFLSEKQKKLYDFIRSGETSFCRLLSIHGLGVTAYAMHLANSWAKKKLEDE